MKRAEIKTATPCSKSISPEFVEMLENFSDEFSDFLTEEAKEYFVEQIEALQEIDKLEESAREHAHRLLTIKDKETSEFKYTPKEVLGFMTEREA